MKQDYLATSPASPWRVGWKSDAAAVIGLQPALTLFFWILVWKTSAWCFLSYPYSEHLCEERCSHYSFVKCEVCMWCKNEERFFFFFLDFYFKRMILMQIQTVEEADVWKLPSAVNKFSRKKQTSKQQPKKTPHKQNKTQRVKPHLFIQLLAVAALL